VYLEFAMLKLGYKSGEEEGGILSPGILPRTTKSQFLPLVVIT
jgi:hypothetical protein